MHKHIAITAAVLVLATCASLALGAEIVMPGASIGGSAGAEIDAPTHEDAITGAGIRGTTGSEAARRHLQPDATSEVHADGGSRASMGTEPASAELTSKVHMHGRWQALLPGVMK